MFIWKQYVEYPGVRCWQLVGFRIVDVVSVVLQRLTIEANGDEHTQWQFLIAVEV